MPMMQCPPGAGFQALSGEQYRDAGEGKVHVYDQHVREARTLAGWTVIAEPATEVASEQIDTALDHLEEGLAAEQQRVDALREAATQEAAPPQEPAEPVTPPLVADEDVGHEVDPEAPKESRPAHYQPPPRNRPPPYRR